MTNFIIYSSNEKLGSYIVKILHNYMNNHKNYEVYLCNRQSDVLNNKERKEGQNIYFLNIDENNQDAIMIARNIRKNGISINDQIIFLAYDNKFLLENNFRGTMYYDYIIIDSLFKDRFINCLNEIMTIFKQKGVLAFKVDKVLYHIPYDEINFISKCKSEEWSMIHTKDKVYKCKNSIVYFEKILNNDVRFFKTHRSCIVNLYNIKHINLDDSKIFFDNEYTDFLSRDHKKELVNYFESINLSI